jgi:methylated-DNA-[protein]-cysteine S-methyltransferase
MAETRFALERLETPAGPMLLVTDAEDRLRAADWEDHDDRLQRLLRRHYGPVVLERRNGKGPSDAAKALAAYFDGELGAVKSVMTATNGTDFQRRVWEALRRIPAGTTLGYGALAARLGRPSAARAVGLANGANPIAIIVPCHRVIGADSSLTGYGGGLARKRWLLAHEGASATPSSQLL